jgi:hypothetical protein
LREQGIHQCGFAVVNVGNNRDVANRCSRMRGAHEEGVLWFSSVHAAAGGLMAATHSSGLTLAWEQWLTSLGRNPWWDSGDLSCVAG